MKTRAYVYTFDNIGDTAFTIDSYEVERTPPGVTTNFSLNVTLVPGSFTVIAERIPGMFVGGDTYSYTDKGN
jgi:hypothetical protein